MSMHPHTVTVLNKVSGSGTVVYLPTKITNSLYYLDTKDSESTTGVSPKSVGYCSIPFTCRQAGSFVDAKTYAEMSLSDKQTHWTLDKGDIIVRGEVSESELSLNTINSNYGNRFTVTSVSSCDFGFLKHWEVSGA